MDCKIVGILARDIRFPTSRESHGSDAMHLDPDYSASYVILQTDHPEGLEGHGLTFTLGRGNEICLAAIEALQPLVMGRTLSSITDSMRHFWRELTSDTQLRWIGPEKGAIHLATAALVNAVWDLWAKCEGKPLWRLLAGLEPEKIVTSIDFRYLTDAITPEWALERLLRRRDGYEERLAELLDNGYPAYTTSTAWLGYSEDRLRSLCRKALAEGWTAFKMKVGADLAQDIRRAAIIREEIGDRNLLMMDANQVWDVGQAISWMGELARFSPHWIEEPTSPDDVLGHAAISRALHPIGVATGEQCQNRVIFKQLMQAEAIQFCQIDSCRVGGVNENLAILLLAERFGVPVCPHAGGVGLCEYVQHLSMFDYLCVSGSMENRMIEFVDHLHEHFLNPVQIRNGRYLAPRKPGYSIEMQPQSLIDYEFPNGRAWRDA